MFLLQWITNTRMPRRKNPLPLPSQTGRIKLHLHQLIHILHHQHIAIKLHNTLILSQTERREFGPAVVETWVGAVVFASGGQKVFDALLGDPADFEGGVAFGGEGVGVQGDEGVF